MLLSDFKAPKPRSIPTPPMAALVEFFYADAEKNVHSLSASGFLILVHCDNICSLAHILTILSTAADVVSSSSKYIEFEEPNVKCRYISNFFCI